MEETRTTPAAESNGVEIRSENVTARVLQLQAEEMEAQRIFSEIKARAARAQVQVQMHSHSHSQPKAEAEAEAEADAPQESSRYQILQSRVNRKLKPQRSNTRRRPSGGSVISRADSTDSRSRASTSRTYRRYSRWEKGKGADHDDYHEDGHGHGHGQEQRSRRFCDSGCLPSCLPTVGLGVGACLQSVVLCNQLGGYSYGGLGYGYGYGYGLGSYYGYGYGYGYPSSCTTALPVATVPYGTCLY